MTERVHLTDGLEGCVLFDDWMPGCGTTACAAAVDERSEQQQEDQSSEHQTNDDQWIYNNNNNNNNENVMMMTTSLAYEIPHGSTSVCVSLLNAAARLIARVPGFSHISSFMTTTPLAFSVCANSV